MTDPQTITHVLTFRGQYGRLCTLAAHAMRHRGCSAEAVRYALSGQGENVALAALREQRYVANEAFGNAVRELRAAGVDRRESIQVCRDAAREARRAVESEWGEDRDNMTDPIWDSLRLPLRATA